MIYVRFQPSRDVKPETYRVPEDKDPFELCNRARERIFPGVKLLERDPVAERILKQMERDGIGG